MEGDLGLSKGQQGEFATLPNELTVQVFSSLTTNDLLSVSQACKHWNYLSEDDTLWKPLYRNRWAQPAQPQGTGFAQIARYFPAGMFPETNATIAGDELEIRGWRSWKNRYTTKINWLNGQVIHATSTDAGHGPAKPLTALQIDDQFYYTGAEDATIRITSVETGQNEAVLKGHSSSISCLQVADGGSPNELIVSGSKDATIKIWRNRECARTLTGHHGKITCLQFSTENNKLITRGYDLMANIWDLETGQLISSRRTNSVCTALHFKQSTMACGYLDDSLRMWDLRTGKCQYVLRSHAGAITSIQFEDSTNSLVTGSADKSARLWDIRACRTTATFDCKTPVASIQFAGTKLVTASLDKIVRVWNTSSRKMVYDMVIPTPIKAMRFDDKKIVAVGNDPRIYIRNFSECMAY